MNAQAVALAGPRTSASVTRLAAPVLVILVLAMMVLPLPTIVLDLLFTFNIALSLIVLMVGLYTLRPLDFSVFPTLLLLTTLLRLSLNVASTRVVLLYGHTGPGAAGKVIESFGQFLVGGNYTVGIVVFVILVVINFVVITKGAGRIAEVSARFTLDAMPGKQMAIDADLNAGLIAEAEARRRRQEVSQEADFFGAMDGASKFVRGDAVAGVLIMIINVVGGLVIGTLQHGLDLGTAANNYILLTVGDGLVAQVPALIISVAAGIVVSRVGTDQDVGQQLLGQLSGRPQVLMLTAGILTLLGLIPGMPHLAFLSSAAILVALTRLQRGPAVAPAPPPVAVQPQAAPAPEVSWDDVVPVDALGLEVGYRLIPLVDKAQEGELLRRIRGIRKKFAQEMGYLVPAVHIRDNLELRPNAYRILTRGVVAGQGEVFVGMFLAINPGHVVGSLPGTATRDPAFGLPAVWIEAEQREQAQIMGYTVVDVSTVVATHISNVIKSNAADLLGRDEVQQLVERLAKESPKLVEETIPKLVSLGALQKVLQNLLREGVNLRDFAAIVATVADLAPRTTDPDELTAAVRVTLGRAIIQQIFGAETELQLIGLDPTLENILMQAARSGDGGGLEPGLAEMLLRQAGEIAERVEQAGKPAVLLAPPGLRNMLSGFLRRSHPNLAVISHSEIPDHKTVKVIAAIGGRA